MLIVAGAQGSGKTYLLKNRLQTSGRYDHYVSLYETGDRELHPRYPEMIEHGAQHAYAHTESFIWALGAKVFTYCLQNQYNFIMETALDSLAFAQGTQAIQRAGYQFEVHLIACHKHFGHWSSLRRLVKSVAKGELERYVSLADIEASQANACSIIAAILNACQHAPGSSCVFYKRGLDTAQDSVEFGRVRYPHDPLELSYGYTNYHHVVTSEPTDLRVRQSMVEVCRATLTAAEPLRGELPSAVFADLQRYIDLYQMAPDEAP